MPDEAVAFEVGMPRQGLRFPWKILSRKFGYMTPRRYQVRLARGRNNLPFRWLKLEVEPLKVGRVEPTGMTERVQKLLLLTA